MHNRLGRLVSLFGPLIRRLSLNVLAHDDDWEEDQLEKRLRDPRDDDDAVSTTDRRRETNQGEDREKVGSPHRAHDRREEQSQLAVEAYSLVIDFGWRRCGTCQHVPRMGMRDMLEHCGNLGHGGASS